jgi:pilus assembly protein FimV
MMVASCLVLSAFPLISEAAGLGKIVVLSALGQPLKAEIEVSATRAELSDMKVQLAPPEVFKQAGVEYATTLLSIRANLHKRKNGRTVIELGSDRPINDPFVDMLLELNWSSGRLVREYTFLLDLPEIIAKKQASVVPATLSSPAGRVKRTFPSTTRPGSSIDDGVRNRALASLRSTESAQNSSGDSTERREVYETRRGDTLRKIAGETKPEGVSLEQMLVGLLRANPDAFDRNNMNNLKAGKTLKVPEKSILEAIPPEQARKTIAAQSEDWNAYRGQLAASAALSRPNGEAGTQDSAGRISARVDDDFAPVSGAKDVVTISTAKAAGGTRGATEQASEDDLVAKDRALQEARERTESLERNIADLNELIELKSQKLAELQGTSANASATTDTSATLVSTTDPVADPVQTTSNPAEPKPAAKSSREPVAPPPPMPEPPSFVEELLANPLVLAAIALVVLLAGYLLYRRKQ